MSEIAAMLANTRLTPNKCMEWLGARLTNGYGVVSLGRRKHRQLAHRRIFELWTDEKLPAGMYVCHRCDNPPCINPDHLFLGTPSDNSRDAREKGRASSPPHPTRDSHPEAKLTSEQVAALVAEKEGGTPAKVLAAKYGVSLGHVYNLHYQARRKAVAA